MTVIVNDLTVSGLIDEITSRPETDVKVTFPYRAGILAVGTINALSILGRRDGLTISDERTGGVLVRHGVLCASGRSGPMLRFLRECRNAMEASQ